jgi:MORN repeat
VDDEACGMGICEYADGSRYQGMWKGTSVVGAEYYEGEAENKRDGKGTLKLANGSVLSGLWKSGQLRQVIEFKLPEGSIWNDLI